MSAQTPATEVMRASGIAFELRAYEYEAHGGTKVSAQKLGADEHSVIKTLVFEDERKAPFIVLMHGDREVGAKALARQLGLKTVQPCKPDVAQRHTGYLVGGTSPFGTKKALPIYCESTIAALDQIFINAGRRGLLCVIEPSELIRVLKPTMVDCAVV